MIANRSGLRCFNCAAMNRPLSICCGLSKHTQEIYLWRDDSIAFPSKNNWRVVVTTARTGGGRRKKGEGEGSIIQLRKAPMPTTWQSARRDTCQWQWIGAFFINAPAAAITLFGFWPGDVKLTFYMREKEEKNSILFSTSTRRKYASLSADKKKE